MKATKDPVHYAIADRETTLARLADVLMSYHSMFHDSFTHQDVVDLKCR